MNDTEKYLFDLNGYLLVRNLLSDRDVNACLRAVDELEAYFQKHIDDEPKVQGFSGVRYGFHREFECHSYKSVSGTGVQYIIDDFLNASSAFDVLVGHEPTMEYIEHFSAGPFRIGNTEARYRYKGNTTPTHMGGRMDPRNHYDFVGRVMYDSSSQLRAVRDFNLLAVRVLYALHDVPVENGPLCVVPGSHKSNFFSPFNDDDPTTEPGMIPIPMKAGDAIFFTENTRHGGFPNLLDRPRKTLHLMYAPVWVASQSPVHWNEQVYVSETAWQRYSEAQRRLLPPPGGEKERVYGELRRANTRLDLENARLTNQAIDLRAERDAAIAELAKLGRELAARAETNESIRELSRSIQQRQQRTSLLSAIARPFRRAN